MQLKKEIESMKKYIGQLENDQFKKMRGAPIPDIKTPQARSRKFRDLKTRAKKALLFCSLFGLELDLLRSHGPEGLKTYTVNLSEEGRPPDIESKSANSMFCVFTASETCSCQFSTSATLL